jgi:hypothetical protein
MKATELLKKLGAKIVGKKWNTPALVQLQWITKQSRVLDRLGVIQLHPNWRT